jgi:putative membrane protein
MERLKSASGADFDRAFSKTMVDDHKKDITAVKTAMAQTADPKLKGLLKSTLPVLEKHLDIAKQLVEKVGATASR